MGKGDRKSGRGKLFRKSYGNTRLSKRKKRQINKAKLMAKKSESAEA